MVEAVRKRLRALLASEAEVRVFASAAGLGHNKATKFLTARARGLEAFDRKSRVVAGQTNNVEGQVASTTASVKFRPS